MARLSNVDILDFETKIDQRLENTLLWLPRDTHYVEWLTRKSAGLLLVTGYPGCGKTVLSSYVRSRLPSDAAAQSIVCRFYCDAKVKEMSSAIGLIKNILHQVVEKSHDMLRRVLRAVKLDDRLMNSFERLWALFESIVTSQTHIKVIIILDALDEFDEASQKTISSKVLALVQSDRPSSIKFFITSRPHAFAVTELRRHGLCLALEQRQDLVGEDVNIFIEKRLSKLVERKGLSDEVQRDMLTALKAKADRSFLWVALTLSYLEQISFVTKADVEAGLSHVSKLPLGPS